MKKKITIAIHDGKFHADEVMSIAILKQIYPNIKIIRTRNKEEIQTANMRVDVGQKYNPKTNDFDHHQINSPIRKNKIPYSSCGLIWKHFGKKLLESKQAWEYIDKELIQGIDAKDNGIETKENTTQIYSLHDLVISLNPFWNETNSEDKQFEKAVAIISEILLREIKKADSIVKGNEILRKCLKKCKKEFITLPNKKLSKDFFIKTKIKFTIFKEKDKWISLAVPIKPKSFQNKKSFPKEWAGLFEKELEEISGIKGALFCHQKRFIAVAKTQKAIIELTEKALKNKS